MFQYQKASGRGLVIPPELVTVRLRTAATKGQILRFYLEAATGNKTDGSITSGLSLVDECDATSEQLAFCHGIAQSDGANGADIEVKTFGITKALVYTTSGNVARRARLTLDVGSGFATATKTLSNVAPGAGEEKIVFGVALDPTTTTPTATAELITIMFNGLTGLGIYTA